MSLASIAEAVWEHDDIVARVGRGLLTPASWLYGSIMSTRNARFDARRPAISAIPALSIGNLTVGGTGKTPVAAWCVQQLRARGAHPSIVMRGVGDDEWRVHTLLSPGIPVIVSPDRVAGMIVARTRGADCAVMDDAFQHRRAARIVDIVLFSADKWTGTARLLPAGPYREPLSSLRRAHVVVVTTKAASAERIEAVLAAARVAAPDAEEAVIRLVPGTLRLATALSAVGTPGGSSRASGGPLKELLSHPPAWLAGRELSAVSAIGDPAAFESQLRAHGAVLRDVRRFPDHHAFSSADATEIAQGARGSSGVVCTLKDAVKLAPRWPREAPPLWYLSQSVVVDRGAEALDRAVARVLAARAATALTAG